MLRVGRKLQFAHLKWTEVIGTWATPAIFFFVVRHLPHLQKTNTKPGTIGFICDNVQNHVAHFLMNIYLGDSTQNMPRFQSISLKLDVIINHQQIRFSDQNHWLLGRLLKTHYKSWVLQRISPIVEALPAPVSWALMVSSVTSDWEDGYVVSIHLQRT